MDTNSTATLTGAALFNDGDTAWMMTSTALVMLMIPGILYRLVSRLTNFMFQVLDISTLVWLNTKMHLV